MNKLLTLSLLFFSQILLAQSVVRGKVSDVNTGEALIGVSIRAENTGATTDGEGNFSLNLKGGKAILTFTYIGYEPQTRNLNLENGQSTFLEIRMDDGSNILNTATVTSGKFEKPLGEVTVSLEVVKPRLIQNSNASTVESVLTKVPGVTILDGQAQIRGGSGFSYGAGTRVLLLVDDLPALQPDAGYPNWSDLPVENISQIEVLKGAASALYGSSAMNGIINLRTGYAKDKPETEIAVFGKIFDQPKDKSMAWWKTVDTAAWKQPFETAFSVCHRRKAGKMDLVLGAYALKLKSFNEKTYKDYARITPNFRFRINDRLSIVLNSNFNFGKSGNFFVWQNNTDGAFRPGLKSESKSLGRLRFTIDPSLTYTDLSGNRHKILSRYYHVHNDLDRNQDNDSRNYYLEYQFQRNFEKIGLVLTSGAVGQRSTVEAQLYGNQKFVANNLGAYLQLDYKPIEKLNLSGGVRYEYFEQYSAELIARLAGGFDTIPNGFAKESRPVFRLGANYQLAKATYLRASFGQGFRYPTIAEKFITTDFSAGNFVVPNAKLESEHGWTAEIGLKQGILLGKNWKGYVDLTGFVSEYSRMMEFVLAKVSLELDPGPPPTFVSKAFFQSQNVGDTRVEGFEISLAGQGKLGAGNLYILGGYTRIFPKYKNFPADAKSSSIDSVNVLKYRFEHTAKLDAEYEIGKFSVGAACQYNSFMRAIDAIFQSPVIPVFKAVGDFRREHNQGAAVWDARASFKPTTHLKVAFLVNNLTNLLYQNRPALMEAPRSFAVRLEYKI